MFLSDGLGGMAMFWNVAVTAAVAAWLLYLALQRRIDSTVAQLRRDLVAATEGLKNDAATYESEVLRELDRIAGQLGHDISGAVEKLKQGRAATAARQEQPRDKDDEEIRENVNRSLSQWATRYGVQDAYTISELTRTYDREDSRGRIRLLRRVYRQTPRLPYDLALRAVTDGDSAVREWMARKGQMLDYEPDRDLAMRLRQDSDPFVRVATFENPERFLLPWFSDRQKWVDEFKGCSPLERLAMMRNEALDLELVKLILDPEDAKLGIEMSERYQLAEACLVNKRVVENGRRARGSDLPEKGRVIWRPSSDDDCSQTVWELVAKWPDRAGITLNRAYLPFKAFHTIQTYDRVKAKIYANCQDDFLRGAILDSCLPEDEETLRLAREDTEFWLRSGAYRRSRRMDRQEIEAALRREVSEKINGLDGLIMNPWLGETAREILYAMPRIDADPSRAATAV